MTKYFGPFLIAVLFSITVAAQPGAIKPASTEKPTAAVAVGATPLDVAKATLAAHGGDKLKKMTSLVIKGSADLTFMGQAMPGAFSTAVSGPRYYFEINSAVQSLKQVYDGKETYSSIPGFSLPPMTSLGFPVLQHIGDTGYIITALSEDKKKKKGFREFRTCAPNPSKRVGSLVPGQMLGGVPRFPFLEAKTREFSLPFFQGGERDDKTYVY